MHCFLYYRWRRSWKRWHRSWNWC